MTCISNSFKKRFIIYFVLIVLAKNGFSQQHDNINDLRNKLAVTEDINIKSDLNLRLATQYLTKPGELKNDLDSAMLLKNKALNLSQKSGNKKGEAQALLLDGKIRLEAGNKVKAQASVATALKFAKQNCLLVEQGECYEAEAQFYNNENEGIANKLRLQNMATQLYH
jgi:hypothetical protein